MKKYIKISDFALRFFRKEITQKMRNKEDVERLLSKQEIDENIFKEIKKEEK